MQRPLKTNKQKSKLRLEHEQLASNQAAPGRSFTDRCTQVPHLLESEGCASCWAIFVDKQLFSFSFFGENLIFKRTDVKAAPVLHGWYSSAMAEVGNPGLL